MMIDRHTINDVEFQLIYELTPVFEIGRTFLSIKIKLKVAAADGQIVDLTTGVKL